MVIFYEEKKPLTRRQKIARRIFTAAIILGVIMWIFLYFLSTLSEKSSGMREGLEDYLRRATGMTPSIGTLTTMRLYPDIIIGAENISLTGAKTGEVIRVDSFNMRASFRDILGKTGKFQAFDIKNMTISAGILTQDRLTVDEAGFRPEPAEFFVAGVYQGSRFVATSGVTIIKTNDGRIIYGKRPVNPIHVKVRDFEGSGTLSKAQGVLSFNFDRVEKLKPLWDGKLDAALKSSAKASVECVVADVRLFQDKVEIKSFYLGRGAASYGGKGVIKPWVHETDMLFGRADGDDFSVGIVGTSSRPNISQLPPDKQEKFNVRACKQAP